MWTPVAWNSAELQRAGGVATLDWQLMLHAEDNASALRIFLTSFLKYGIAKFVNVPPKLGQLEIFGDFLGYIRNSNYG